MITSLTWFNARPTCASGLFANEPRTGDPSFRTAGDSAILDRLTIAMFAMKATVLPGGFQESDKHCRYWTNSMNVITRM